MISEIKSTTSLAQETYLVVDLHRRALRGVPADSIHKDSVVEAEDIVEILEQAIGDKLMAVVLSLLVASHGSNRW